MNRRKSAADRSSNSPPRAHSLQQCGGCGGPYTRDHHRSTAARSPRQPISAAVKGTSSEVGAVHITRLIMLCRASQPPIDFTARNRVIFCNDGLGGKIWPHINGLRDGSAFRSASGKPRAAECGLWALCGMPARPNRPPPGGRRGPIACAFHQGIVVAPHTWVI
jgi:hypothetical protein